MRWLIINNKDNKYGIIYCATNTINNKKYIGQTIRSLDKRIKEHISHASKDNKYAFHLAINKYRIDKFEWEEIDVANNQEELDEKELYWIDFYNTYGKGGYNMSVGGQFNKKTDDNADKLSEMNGGREFLVFDLDGNFIKSAFSQTAFAEEIGACVQSINNVLRGIKNQVKYYILIFKDEFNKELLNKKINKSNLTLLNKEFYVFDKCNFNFIGCFDNREYCQNEIGVDRKTITRSLDSENKNSRNKFLFYYKDNIPQDLEFKIKIKEVI